MGLVSELRRRNVLRMVVLYVVAAWLIMQVAEVIIGLANLPEWVGPTILGLLAVGFPIALIFSWFYELTPEGLSLEKDVAPGESITHVTGRRMDFIVISLLSAAVILFAWHTWWPSAPTDKSIAVMAFENMSGDPEQEYFSDGISEELLNALAHVPELRVISRSSAFSFKGKDVAAPEIARQLSVANVLEGSVRKMGNRVRITAQLIEASTDSHLWSETYDRELATQNIFAIQSEIAAAITHKLQATLSPQDEANLNKMPTHNLQAYEAYLLGKQQMRIRSGDSLAEAIDHFRKAIELDPGFALAHVGLADSYQLQLESTGGLPTLELNAKARVEIEAALDLDDQLGEAHASLALLMTREGDFDGAEETYRHAIALKPNYAAAFHWYGNMLVTYLQQPERAVPMLERAIQLDPLSPVINVTLGEAFESLGRFEEAMALYRNALEIEPGFPSAYYLIAEHYRLVHGRLDEAARWHLKSIALDPGRTLEITVLASCFLDLGDEAQAERWINLAMSQDPGGFAPNAALTSLHRYRGQQEDALAVARLLSGIAPGNNNSLFTLVSYGQYREAIESSAGVYPELSCDVAPILSHSNLFPAINLSLALEETGYRECAARMLDKSLEFMKGMPRLGYSGYGIADVEVYARQGRIRLALDTLRQAIDQGYRSSWWSQGEGSPHMVALLEEPEFKSMMDEIRADMAIQLARVRAMEANGELAPIPE